MAEEGETKRVASRASEAVNDSRAPSGAFTTGVNAGGSAKRGKRVAYSVPKTRTNHLSVRHIKRES
jgi:hypothetical protein